MTEVNRDKEIVWSYETDNISHDADRLSDGNTIFVWGHPDGFDDAQVTEVNQQGEIVWRWYAKDHFNVSPYKDIDPEEEEGWTHTNAVTRLSNGNTLICLRNFHIVVEVETTVEGNVVETYGTFDDGPLFATHDPEMQRDGHILVASFRPERVVEIDSVEIDAEEVVHWEFRTGDNGIQCNRDANRLPNGNILVCGAKKVAEVTRDGVIVWQLILNVNFEEGREKGAGFAKAERIFNTDGDGIFDVVDLKRGMPSVEFSDGNTSGRVVSLEPGISILVTNARNPADGVKVVVSGPADGIAKIVIFGPGGGILDLPPGEYIFTTGSMLVRIERLQEERAVKLRLDSSTGTYKFTAEGEYVTRLGPVTLEVAKGGLAEVEYIIGGTIIVVIVESREIVSLDESIVEGELQDVTIAALLGEVTVNGVVVPEGESLTRIPMDIKHMTIQWARDSGIWRRLDKDVFSIYGRFQLPEGYTLDDLERQATTSISIDGSTGSNTVELQERELRRLGVIWTYRGDGQPSGEGMSITRMIIWWAPEESE